MYARTQENPVGRGDRGGSPSENPCRDCDSCETKTGRVDQFERIVDLEGDLTDAERVRLLEIADRCPVHRTLESEIDMRTRAGAVTGG